MSGDIALSNAEIALAKFIHENVELISSEVIDWSKMRMLSIQECVDYGYSVNMPAPIANACDANCVNRKFYAMHDVYKIAKILKNQLQN